MFMYDFHPKLIFSPSHSYIFKDAKNVEPSKITKKTVAQ